MSKILRPNPFKRFFIRRKIKNLPPISPASLIPMNAEEEGFIKEVTFKHMKRTGQQPEDFIPYFVDYRIKGHKVKCRAVGIRKLRKI